MLYYKEQSHLLLRPEVTFLNMNNSIYHKLRSETCIKRKKKKKKKLKNKKKKLY